jgi:polyhydroxyalkanoate synthase
MNNGKNPLEEMMQLFNRQAQAYAAGMKLMLEKLGQSSVNPAADPAQAAGFFRQLAEVTTLLWQVQTQAMQAFLDHLPESQRQRIQQQTFSQLENLARGNWMEQMKKLAEQPLEMAERIKELPPERLRHLCQSMWQEMAQDLSAIGPADLQPNLAPLAEAFAKVFSSDPDPAARATVERFFKAAAIKVKYGAEYYADPQNTPVGLTPRQLVWQQGPVSLWRYQRPAAVPPAQAEPVLVVYSVINKPYILDLVPGYSFIEHLLGRGLEVYLIEWAQPAAGDSTTLDELIEPGISGSVEQIEKISNSPRVSLFGHCIGGNLALLYAALHPQKVARLLVLTMPVTAARGGVVALWTDRHLFPVDEIVDTFGLMPAKLIRYTFMALKPYYEVLKWKMFLENLHNPQVMALFDPVDRWANENVDIPAEVFRKFVKEVLHEDRFQKGGTTIHGRPAAAPGRTCQRTASPRRHRR